jgi:hypothetical protein
MVTEYPSNHHYENLSLNPDKRNMKLMDVYINLAPESFKPLLMQNEWQYFIRVYWAQIAPLYLENEACFDSLGIHGVSHAFRTSIAAQLLNANFVDFYDLVYPIPAAISVIALHDVGRLGNGSDLWETLSCGICKKKLQKWFWGTNYGVACEAIISQPASLRKGLSALLHDADALEYTRFLSRGEFDPYHLSLYIQNPTVDLGIVDQIASYLIELQDWERYPIQEK